MNAGIICYMLTGRKVFKSTEKFTSDTKRALRIYLCDYSQETQDRTKPKGFRNAEQDLGHRVYDMLEFGRFLRQRIFHKKI